MTTPEEAREALWVVLHELVPAGLADKSRIATEAERLAKVRALEALDQADAVGVELSRQANDGFWAKLWDGALDGLRRRIEEGP